MCISLSTSAGGARTHKMSEHLICVVYSTRFAGLDIPLKCYSCSETVHSKCSGLTVTEIKCIMLKNRSLKYFYSEKM